MSKLENPLSEQEEVKNKKWAETSQEVEVIGDKLGKKIDENIKETVVALKVLDFETSASCEGHLDHGIASPWVDIRFENKKLLDRFRSLNKTIDEEESRDPESAGLGNLYDQLGGLEKEKDQVVLVPLKRLADLFSIFYNNRTVEFGTRLIMDMWPWGCRIQCQGAELQDVASPEEREENLRKYQAEMNAFVSFLKESFFRS